MRRSIVSLCGQVRVASAFTLTELLVVVAILSLLMGILIPSLHTAIVEVRRKAVCAANLRAIAEGTKQYAYADRRKRLPSVFRLHQDADKDHPGVDSWYDMETGNPACLWLLVEDGYAARSAFLCPEAGSRLGWQEPDQTDNQFKWDATTGISTLSYSYISMTQKEEWGTGDDEGENLGAKMTMSHVPQTLVILADKNPRSTFESTELKTYETIDSEHGGNLEERAGNSPNHKRLGQNIARFDASVTWIDDPNEPTNGNDIYSSDVESDSEEREGRRAEMLDVFLIP